MDNKITYCNTDLELKSASDLSALAAEFEARGLDVLHVTHSEDGQRYSIVEAKEPWSEPEIREPERSIGEMLAAVESLAQPLRSVWMSCTLREFNIGYDCGDEPWAVNQGLSKELLARIVNVGATLRWTLYPDRPVHNAETEQQDVPLA
jgi:hypothetical protein